MIRSVSHHSGNIDDSQWEWIWKCVEYAQCKEAKDIERTIPWIKSPWTEYVQFQDNPPMDDFKELEELTDSKEHDEKHRENHVQKPTDSNWSVNIDKQSHMKGMDKSKG